MDNCKENFQKFFENFTRNEKQLTLFEKKSETQFCFKLMNSKHFRKSELNLKLNLRRNYETTNKKN